MSRLGRSTQATPVAKERATLANMPLELVTLAGDNLFITGFSGQEAISRPFHFVIDAKGYTRSPVDFRALLGSPVGVRLTLNDEVTTRWFNGVCTRVQRGESEGGQARHRPEGFYIPYRLDVRPRFWLLTRRTLCRTFESLSVPDVLRQVLKGLDVDWQVKGDYPTREYLVQYRESDFAFASRLMEQEGIFYFFRHTEHSHRMVVADGRHAHDAPPAPRDVVVYRNVPAQGPGTMEKDVGIGAKKSDSTNVVGLGPATTRNTRWPTLDSWVRVQELTASGCLVRDVSFEMPGKTLDQTESARPSVPMGTYDHQLLLHGNDELKLYHWPGEWAHHFDGVAPGGAPATHRLNEVYPEGARVARLRMEEETTPGLSSRGASNVRHLAAGDKINVTVDPDDVLAQTTQAAGRYVLTEVSHETWLSGHRTEPSLYVAAGGHAGTAWRMIYENTFTCIPWELPFRPSRVTPRPIVHGPQTAVVVRDATDQYGRVQVMFPWDRQDQGGKGQSCWLRVATAWAGRRWGITFVPRIGQEVLVDFLEGDPDRPVVVGCLYNDANRPPYLNEGVPDPRKNNRWVSGIKTSNGGSGFNELRFDDTADEEQLYLHAQRNLEARVRKDSLETVGQDAHRIVGRHQLDQVEGDAHRSVKGDDVVKIDGSASQTVGGDLQEKVRIRYALDAGSEIHLKSGNNLVLEAATITLKAGGSFLTLSGNGVAVKGQGVLLNSGGEAGSGAGCQPDSPRAPSEAEAGVGVEPLASRLEPLRLRVGGPARPVPHTFLQGDVAGLPTAKGLRDGAQNANPFVSFQGLLKLWEAEKPPNSDVGPRPQGT